MILNTFSRKIVRLTSADINLTADKIMSELSQNGYTNIKRTNGLITFKYNYWKLGPSWRFFEKIDGGDFEILPSSEHQITLKYHFDPSFPIIAIILVIILCVTKDYHMWFFIVFIILMFGARWINMKNIANRMLDSVAK